MAGSAERVSNIISIANESVDSCHKGQSSHVYFILCCLFQQLNITDFKESLTYQKVNYGKKFAAVRK